MSVTKSFSSNLALHSRFQNYLNAPPFGPTTHTDVTKVLSISRSVTYGDNVKDWREKIALGQSATTTLVGTSTMNITSTGGIISAYSNGSFPNELRWQYTGDLFAQVVSATVPVASTVMDTVAESRAASRFLSKYIAAKNTWRGGNFIAEIRETFHALRHPVKSFYHRTWDFAGTVKRIGAVYQKDRQYAKHLGNAWLAYAFGVKPLIADINDATQAANELRTEGLGHDSKTISGYGRNTSYTKTSGLQLSSPPGNSDLFCKYTAYTNELHSVRYYGLLKASLADTTSLVEKFGVGVFDVVPAIWEAIPWSFFIDYFANVGEMLDSFRLISAEFGWCNRTVRNTTARTLMDVYYQPTTSLRAYVGGSPKLYTLARYVSRAPSIVPAPHFHFQVPGLASMKWLNIAALSAQVLSSKPALGLKDLAHPPPVRR